MAFALVKIIFGMKIMNAFNDNFRSSSGVVAKLLACGAIGL